MTLSTISKTPFSTIQREKLSEIPFHAYYAQQDRAIKSRIEVPYIINTDELEYLQYLYPGQHIMGGTIAQQHAVFRHINDEINNRYRAYSRVARKNNVKTLCIGGTSEDLNHYDHVDTRISDVLDFHRVSKRAHTSRPFIAANKSVKCCINGTENCNFKASIAYAADSMYDIPFHHLPKIFEEHQLNELYFSLILPHTLINKRWYCLESSEVRGIYRVEVYEKSRFGSKKERRLRFTTMDGNPVYDHEFNNLAAYLNIGAIFTPGYTITIEILKRRDIFYDFVAVKNDYSSSILYSEKWLPKFSQLRNSAQLYGKKHAVVNTEYSADQFIRYTKQPTDEYVILPNISKIIGESVDLETLVTTETEKADFITNMVMKIETWQANAIIMPSSIASSVLSWAATQTFETLTPNALATYLRSKASKITLAGTVKVAGWEVGANTFEQANIALFIYAVLQKELQKEVRDHAKSLITIEKRYEMLPTCFRNLLQSLDKACHRYFNQTRATRKYNNTSDLFTMVNQNLASYNSSFALYTVNEKDIPNFVFVSMPDELEIFGDVKEEKEKPQKKKTTKEEVTLEVMEEKRTAEIKIEMEKQQQTRAKALDFKRYNLETVRHETRAGEPVVVTQHPLKLPTDEEIELKEPYHVYEPIADALLKTENIRYRLPDNLISYYDYTPNIDQLKAFGHIEPISGIIKTSPSYQMIMPEYAVNASNLEGKLGGGTSGALYELAGENLQFHMNTQKIISAMPYVTKSTEQRPYFNNLKGVFHVPLDREKVNDFQYMSTVYHNLHNAITDDPDAHDVWHCVLGSGIFKGSYEMSLYLLMLNRPDFNKPINIAAIEHKVHVTSFDECFNAKTQIAKGDGHCLFHAVAAGLNIKYEAIIALVNKKTLYENDGSNKPQTTDVLIGLWEKLNARFIIHNKAYRNHEVIGDGANVVAILQTANHYDLCLCHHTKKAGGGVNFDAEYKEDNQVLGHYINVKTKDLKNIRKFAELPGHTIVAGVVTTFVASLENVGEFIVELAEQGIKEITVSGVNVDISNPDLVMEYKYSLNNCKPTKEELPIIEQPAHIMVYDDDVSVGGIQYKGIPKKILKKPTADEIERRRKEKRKNKVSFTTEIDLALTDIEEEKEEPAIEGKLPDATQTEPETKAPAETQNDEDWEDCESEEEWEDPNTLKVITVPYATLRQIQFGRVKSAGVAVKLKEYKNEKALIRCKNPDMEIEVKVTKSVLAGPDLKSLSAADCFTLTGLIEFAAKHKIRSTMVKGENYLYLEFEPVVPVPLPEDYDSDDDYTIDESSDDELTNKVEDETAILKGLLEPGKTDVSAFNLMRVAPGVKLQTFVSATHNTGAEDKCSVYDKIAPLIDMCKSHTILDLSCAPGSLARDLKLLSPVKKWRITTAAYNGKGATDCHPNMKPDYYYNKLKDAKIPQLKTTDLVIFDCPYYYAEENIKYLVELMNKDYFRNLIIKGTLWDPKDGSTSELTKIMDLTSDYSRTVLKSPKAHSSEFYVLVSRNGQLYDNFNIITNKLRCWVYDNNITLSNKQLDEMVDEQTVMQEVTIDDARTLQKECSESKLEVLQDLGEEMLTSEEYQNYIKDHTKITVECKWVTGVAGCGKSHNIHKYKSKIIITSTKRNVQQIRRNAGISAKTKVLTPHLALLELLNKPANHYERIVVDEAQELTRGMLYLIASRVQEIHLTGDPNQIKPIDFEKKWDGHEQRLTFPKQYNYPNTKRCPTDIAKICNKLYGIGMSSLARTKSSLFKASVENLELLRGGLSMLITPTEATMKKYNADATIHMYKGGTSPVVGLIVESSDDMALLQDSNHQWAYTGITRHTHALVIIEPHSNHKFYNILSAALSDILENDLPTTDLKIKLPEIKQEHKAEKHVEEKGDPLLVKEILEFGIPPVNTVLENVDIIQTGDLGIVEDGKLIVSDSMLTVPAYKNRGRGMLAYTNYVRHYKVTNNLLAVQTLIDRYAKKKPYMSDQALITACQDLWKGLLKWTKYDTVEELQASLHTTTEERSDAIKAYFDNLQERLNKLKTMSPELRSAEWKILKSEENEVLHSCKIDEILNTPWEDVQKGIDFFMKHQGKYKGEPGWDAEFKAGQGVSSVSKAHNIIIAAVARMSLKKVKEALKDNVKITSGEPITAYKQWYVEQRSRVKKPIKIAMADAEKWDASNDIANIMFDAQMFYCVMTDSTMNREHLDFYMNPVYVRFMDRVRGEKPLAVTGHWAIDQYIRMRLRWKMVLRTNKGSALLHGNAKQLSGQQHTLGGNTINNMAQIGALMVIEELTLAMFQGDDSQVEGIFYFDKIASDNLVKRGWKYKIHETDTEVGEYVGYITHANGWMPDLFKRSAILISKIWDSKEKFDESKIGLADCFSVVNDATEKEWGLQAALVYYRENTDIAVDYKSLSALYNFCVGVSKSDWSKLQNKENYPFLV